MVVKSFSSPRIRTYQRRAASPGSPRSRAAIPEFVPLNPASHSSMASSIAPRVPSSCQFVIAPYVRSGGALDECADGEIGVEAPQASRGERPCVATTTNRGALPHAGGAGPIVEQLGRVPGEQLR